ncbi:D-(-)-3-hydroxybutyrate oligomer hydrolase [Azoarcus olearius]|uniref:D-(-)-3-hydroxybutyrate oligomer hydrolase n=1 Tax=Azoarcus sp. (strain BH72) TaxID=418699 RepID=UPI0008062A88|nr:D-(-)-3-hydroxybutyrate oligomer hydrolase [Azoarcus olearius]ANQ86796.1 D-(-)-3-hydroxybutyrate oligomer hydrolase [Azoarcus olearius]
MNPSLCIAVAFACPLSALAASGAPGVGFNEKPSFLGEIVQRSVDGVSDDLLTAGLGRDGIQSATPPLVSASPTATELRRLAIYNNYRALVDTTSGGGFGSLFGPLIAVDAGGRVSAPGDGKIAGTEYLAYAIDRGDDSKVTLMVQVPAHFNPKAPCIVTGTSSGSRGIYGAIGTSGEWGLQKGCAVAYADKGTGNGMHDLDTNTVGLIDGTRAEAVAAGVASHFTADLTDAERTQFLASWPHRVAVKHAHSRANPEAHWGQDTLDAVRFAFFVLNETYGRRTPRGIVRTILPPNTVVIASSVSNGGGAALAAAEQDDERLIDGVAVGEPQIQLRENDAVRVVRGSQVRTGTGRPLYDYTTFANLLQPCAVLSPRAAGSPGEAFIPAALAANRCEALAAHEFITGNTPAERGDSALDALVAYGWEPESTPLTASHYAFAVPPIALTYANAYGRFGVEERVCNYSFAATDAAGTPIAWPAASAATSFGTGNGIPPAAGLQIINDASLGGPRRDGASISPSTGKLDFNVDGALCLRQLWTGGGASAREVHESVDEVQVSAQLQGRPAIIVHGRADALVPVGFTSRPYLGLNSLAEHGRSRLRYVEVTNAQHFDAFIGTATLPGYDTRFVPLHVYFRQALDLMYSHLTARTPLPPSQLVRTTPRAGTPGAAVAITAANVPPIRMKPAAADLITVRRGEVVVPD